MPRAHEHRLARAIASQDASVWLLLPVDLAERVAHELLDGLLGRLRLGNGPLLARTLLGPGTLSADGAAYRLVGTALGLRRSPAQPTWRGVIAELRNDWNALPGYEMFDPTMTSTLWYALENDMPLLRDAALASGADLDHLYSEGTALFRACRAGRTAVVEWLIAAGASVNLRADVERPTPLHAACWRNHIDVVRALLVAGANVHAVDQNGGTALDRALMQGHVDVVRVLVAAGADAPYLADAPDVYLEWNVHLEGGLLVPGFIVAREALAARGNAQASPHLARLLARPCMAALLGV